MGKSYTEPFIGTGINPNSNVPDIPLGLGMELAQSPQATAAFGRLSDAQKTHLIQKIQASKTGDEAKKRIADTIRALTEDGTSN